MAERRRFTSIRRPATAPEFIGSVNVFEGLLKAREEDGLVIDALRLDFIHLKSMQMPLSLIILPVYVALRRKNHAV